MKYIFEKRTLVLIVPLILSGFLWAPALVRAQVQEAKLFDPNAERGDSFGGSVALEGDRAVVGAAGTMEGAGSVFIFERDGSGEWEQVGKLFSDNEKMWGNFGSDVAISGDRLLVGAQQEDANASYAGAAYIFERQANGVWQQMARLIASDGGPSNDLGSAVDLDGDLALAGAFQGQTNGDYTGAAYIFERQANGDWVEVAKLTPGDIAMGDWFGTAVSIEGNRALIGSPNSDGAAFNQGGAYVFERQNDGSWLEVAKLVAGDGGEQNAFGSAVSLSGGRALIGASGANENMGFAYIFEEVSAGNWVEVAKLQASDRAVYDRFGDSVSLLGDRALIGSWGDNHFGVESGSAFVFERLADGTWIERAKLTASDGAIGDNFGRDVELGDDRAVIGALRSDQEMLLTGSAYIFDLTPRPISVTGFTLIDPKSDNPIPGYDPIPDNAVINLQEVSPFVTIRANVLGPVESVRFKGEGIDRVESVQPYALFGDTRGDYFEGRLGPGTQQLSAKAYSKDFAQGESSPATTLEFTVIKEGGSLRVTQFVLVDPITDEDMYVLEDGATIDVPALGFSPNIRADVFGPVNSVKFLLEPRGWSHVQNVPPYALFGDYFEDYAEGEYEAGIQVVTATPYSEEFGAGRAGRSLSVEFNVINWPALSEKPDQPRDAFSVLPDAYTLGAAYPNPFNPTTTVSFALPEPAHVRLIVYDMLGREVDRLVDGTREAGNHTVVFDAGRLPSGSYLYRLETPAGVFVERMLLLK